MKRRTKLMLGLGLLAAAPAAFAQTYNMDLTGVGNGTVADGVYVSPYVGTVQGNGLNYLGYLICDDFRDESYLNSPWTATMSSAGALNGTELFSGSVMFQGTSYTAQQAYDAVGWLANGLLAHMSNQTSQIDYSFAIWNIFDNQAPSPDGGGLEQQAFAAVAGGYVASNVSVLTPYNTVTQEFLMVTPAPEIDATASTAALTLLVGGVLVFGGRRKLQA